MPLSRATVLAIALTLCAPAENKTNFSGTWKLNVAKSDLGDMPRPDSVIEVIEQSGDTIKVVDRRGNNNSSALIRTDGTETASNIPSFGGGEVTLSAEWNGPNLAITFHFYNRKHAPIKGSVGNSVWSLSSDGKTLTWTEHVAGRGFEMNQRSVFERQCGAMTTSAAPDFRDGILGALRAAEEPDPFASIRGDFDLSGSDGRQWKTSLRLPDAEKCGLTKTPLTAPAQAAAWTFACTFRSACDDYEGMVKSVQTALKLPYQPDDTAANVNRVFFADPSKPAWRFFVAKINETAIRIWVVAVRSADGSLTFPSAERLFPPVPTALHSDPTIREEIDSIRSGEHGPFPPIQPSGGAPSTASPGGTGAFSVKNDTAYKLTVLFSGPTERRVEVVPGGSASIELLPGSYKVAARVNAPDVSPSYGEHVFDRSSSGVVFYIAP